MTVISNQRGHILVTPTEKMRTKLETKSRNHLSKKAGEFNAKRHIENSRFIRLSVMTIYLRVHSAGLIIEDFF